MSFFVSHETGKGLENKTKKRKKRKKEENKNGFKMCNERNIYIIYMYVCVKASYNVQK